MRRSYSAISANCLQTGEVDMLSGLGRLSAAVVIAGGSLLLRAQPAKASGSPFCSPEQQYYACYSSGQSSFKQNGIWYCAHYAGDCNVVDGEVSWSIMYVENGEEPCPPVLLC